MIHVIASIFIKDKKMADVLKIYETFAPQVNQEEGCLLYLPTIDCKTDIATQVQAGNIVTVIEKWESMAAFKKHLAAPHVVEFRENIKEIVEKVSIKVLKSALGVDAEDI